MAAMPVAPGDEVFDSEVPLPSSHAQTRELFRIPATLTLRGSKVVLKTPTSQDDAAMREILSEPRNVELLPHLQRRGGWTVKEVASRREGQIAGQSKDEALVLHVHLPGSKKEKSLRGTAADDKDAKEEEHLTLVGTTGFTSVNRQSRESEIGCLLDHTYWRRGIATEAMFLCLRYAFQALGMQSIDWITTADNKDMRGWCEGLLQMKPVHITVDALGGAAVKYTLVESEWQSRVSHFVDQKLSSVKS